MAAEKHSFEVKAHVNSVEVAVGEKLIRVDAGDHYETSDPEVARELAAHPSLKATDVKADAKSTGGKS